jgi:hypothetical protein
MSTLAIIAACHSKILKMNKLGIRFKVLFNSQNRRKCSVQIKKSHYSFFVMPSRKFNFGSLIEGDYSKAGAEIRLSTFIR